MPGILPNMLDILCLSLQVHYSPFPACLVTQEANPHGVHQWVPLPSDFQLDSANESSGQEMTGRKRVLVGSWREEMEISE